MCVSPVKIRNPNYGNKTDLIRKTADTESQFICVPCGVCSECLMKRQSDIVQRARCLALDHYIFFCTLTYDNGSIPSVVTSTGFNIYYVDFRDVQCMMKRIRKADAFGRSFLYYFVSERGKTRGRPHVHGLIFIPKKKEDDVLYTSQLETAVRKVIFKEWRRNYGSNRKPDWKPLFTYHSKYRFGQLQSNFDVHYVVPYSTEKGEDDVAYYVTKYVLKPNDKEKNLQSALKLNLPDDEYKQIWKIVRSRSVCSKGFGASTELEKDYIRSCIELSQDDPNGFQYYSKDGTASGLARYYRRFVSADAAVRSVAARGGPFNIDSRSYEDKVNSMKKGKLIRTAVSNRDISEFLLFDD